jgi:hypothetical protein
MANPGFRSHYWYWILVLPFVFCCGVSQTAPDSMTTAETRQPIASPQSNGADKSNDPLDSGFFNGMPEGAKEVWQHFKESGRYRIARASDFKIPGWAMNAYSLDLNDKIKYPQQGGDIDGDGAFYDFAVIVLDTTRTEPSKFGIAIFNEPKNEKESYTVHWLYRDTDLSKTVLEWWSGGLAVREYLEDGSYRHCYVNWNSQRQEYTCDKKYKKR